MPGRSGRQPTESPQTMPPADDTERSSHHAVVATPAAIERAEIEAEQAYVDKVYDQLARMADRAAEVGRDGHQRGMLGYTGELKEDDLRSLFERDVMVDHAARRLAVIDAQREGLVFGRLDQRGGEVRYIGRIGVRDDDLEPLVIDWRAPAAAVFYQATAADPKGVVRRRVLRCRGQKVVSIEDDLLDAEAAPPDLPVVGEGALLAALTTARGHQMRDIVATIQREQDEIIRSPSNGVTLISGGPGTGKTVVALHRAAYLLYTERRRMAAGRVLVVGPTPVFMNYIERVLPSLGEHEATLRSLGEVVDGVVATRTDPFDVAVVKGSLRMQTLLARAVRAPMPGEPDKLRLWAAGRVLRLDADELARIRRAVLRHGAVRRNRARGDAVRALLAVLWQKEFGEDGDERSRAAWFAEVAEQEAFVRFVDAWWPVLTPAQVLRQLADPEFLAQVGYGLLSRDEIELLARSWAGLRAVPAHGDRRDSYDPTVDPLEVPSRELYTVEDIPLLDELHALLGEPRLGRSLQDADDEDDDPFDLVPGLGPDGRHEPNGDVRYAWPSQYHGYAHVLVDEAQDLSPMQWRMLGRRGRKASWTIVGDPAQSWWPDVAEAEAARDAAVVGRSARDGERAAGGQRAARSQVRHFRLTTNYRNSREIFEVAAQVIRARGPATELELPRAVRTTGHPPEHVVVAAAEIPAVVRSHVHSLLHSVGGTVGVIVPESAEAEAAAWLVDLGEDHQEMERVRVTSARRSKGLEFDAVVLVEPHAIAAETSTGTRTLYVALTRATQRLVTVSTTRFEELLAKGDVCGEPGRNP